MVRTDKVAQLPVDKFGRLYHLGLRQGELAQRILTVGDLPRAFAVGQHLDGAVVDQANPTSLGPSIFVHTSSRGFTTITGTFEGVPVSIVAIGMGYPMMDFLVREARVIVSGPMAIIRFGTCGSLYAEEEVGSFCVSDVSYLVTRNVDAILENKCPDACYTVSRPCLPSEDLTAALKASIQEAGVPLHSGPNATADSFYCSQGRFEDAFVDRNDDLMEHLRTKYAIRTLEMETFQLFHLAQCAIRDSSRPIKAAAVKIIAANRTTDEFLACEDTRRHVEKVGGLFCLKALKTVSL